MVARWGSVIWEIAPPESPAARAARMLELQRASGTPSPRLFILQTRKLRLGEAKDTGERLHTWPEVEQSWAPGLAAVRTGVRVAPFYLARGRGDVDGTWKCWLTGGQCALWCLEKLGFHKWKAGSHHGDFGRTFSDCVHACVCGYTGSGGKTWETAGAVPPPLDIHSHLSSIQLTLFSLA